MFRSIALMSVLLIGCSQQGAITPAEEARRAMEEGREAVLRNHNDRALDRLDSSIAIQPTPDAYRLRAGVFYGKGDVAKALDDIEKGLTLDPDNAKLKDFRKTILDAEKSVTE